jgi:hypothetical protein
VGLGADGPVFCSAPVTLASPALSWFGCNDGLGLLWAGPLRVNRVALTLRRPLPVFLGNQTFSAATPRGCKRFERGAGAVYKKQAGIGSRHHDDTMMRDENRVKKCKKYLILLNKFAGVVQWQNGSFPI